MRKIHKRYKTFKNSTSGYTMICNTCRDVSGDFAIIVLASPDKRLKPADKQRAAWRHSRAYSDYHRLKEK